MRGLRNRRRIRTSASLSLVFLSLAKQECLLLYSHYQCSRDRLACAKTSSSRKTSSAPQKNLAWEETEPLETHTNLAGGFAGRR